MPKWIDPIDDRTQADINARTAKAFINVLDWARIYGDVRYAQAVVNAMLALNIPVTDLVQPTITTIPSVDDVNAMIADIERLRVAASLPISQVVALKTDYKAGPSQDAPDYRAVNDWERDLRLIRDLLAVAAEQALYCGAFNCGQDRIIANSFRPWRGYVLEAGPSPRLPRLGAKAGANLMRQNHWSSSADHWRMTPRCNVACAGASSIRQNSWRRYA